MDCRRPTSFVLSLPASLALNRCPSKAGNWRDSKICSRFSGITAHNGYILSLEQRGGDSVSLRGVKCTVSNCKFWGQNEECTASAIEVNVDGGGGRAHKSEQTNCHTFASKGG
mgnify:CR=1 FL=1